MKRRAGAERIGEDPGKPQPGQGTSLAVEADRCVHSRLIQASCRACVESCPRGAWRLGDGGLSLDTSRCDACGLCAAVCPREALHLEQRLSLRRQGDSWLAVLECEQELGGQPGRMRCHHALGLGDLVRLYQAGVRQLAVGEDRCHACPRDTTPSFRARLDHFNALLRERGLEPMRAPPWDKKQRLAARNADTGFGGDGLSRRAFLRSALAFAQGNQRELPLHPSGGDHPADFWNQNAPAGARYPWAIRIEAERCTGCGDCARICPDQAIRLEAGEGIAALRLDSARCDGCGLCRDLCPTAAIHPEPFAPLGPAALPLASRRCRACGATYHQAASSPVKVEDCCPVCRKTHHRRLLYQVLD